jgi:succinoglycan biosynthesis protein ExoA
VKADNTDEFTESTSFFPFVSVVVPIRNEQHYIAATLRAILDQDYPPESYEVLVVDGMSTDSTLEIVQSMGAEDSRIRVFENPRHWSSAARNIGIRASRGELIVIIDGHCDVDCRYLSKMVAAFERTQADCLGRPQPLNIATPTPTQAAIALARGSWLGHHPASYTFSSQEIPVPAHSVAVAYRRYVFLQPPLGVGMFDETMDACEDVELNHRVDQAGFTCYLIPELEVAYHPRRTLTDLFRQMTRYGQGRVRLLRKHPETFSALGFAPLWLLLFCLFGGAILAITPLLTYRVDAAGTVAKVIGELAEWWSVAYGSVLALYFFTTFATSVQLAVAEKKWRLLPRTMAVFPTVHFGAAYGMLREFVRGLGRRNDKFSIRTYPTGNC